MVKVEQEVQNTNNITMVLSLLQENLALEKMELNLLSDLQEKLAQEPLDLIVLKETLSMQLTAQQEPLRSENRLLATRLDATEIGILDLGKRIQKLESTGETKTNLEEVFEARLAKVAMDFDQQLQTRFDKITRDFEEECASKMRVEAHIASEVGALKTHFEDLEKRLAVCESKLTWQLASSQPVQDTAAPLASLDGSSGQPNDSVTKSQGQSQGQSEIRNLWEELMPMLSEKSLSQAFEGTMQTELERIKKTVDAQLEEFKEPVTLLSTQESKFRDTFREDFEANSKGSSSYNTLLEKVAMKDKSELTPAYGVAISKIRSLMPQSLDEGVAKDADLGIHPPVATSAVTPSFVGPPPTPTLKDISENFWKNERAIQVAEEASLPPPRQVFLRVRSPSPRAQQSPSRTSHMQVYRQATPSPKRTLSPASSFSPIGLAQSYLSAPGGTTVLGHPHSRNTSPSPYKKLITRNVAEGPELSLRHPKSVQLQGIASRVAV